MKVGEKNFRGQFTFFVSLVPENRENEVSSFLKGDVASRTESQKTQ